MTHINWSRDTFTTNSVENIIIDIIKFAPPFSLLTIRLAVSNDLKIESYELALIDTYRDLPLTSILVTHVDFIKLPSESFSFVIVFYCALHGSYDSPFFVKERFYPAFARNSLPYTRYINDWCPLEQQVFHDG